MDNDEIPEVSPWVWHDHLNMPRNLVALPALDSSLKLTMSNIVPERTLSRHMNTGLPKLECPWWCGWSSEATGRQQIVNKHIAEVHGGERPGPAVSEITSFNYINILFCFHINPSIFFLYQSFCFDPISILYFAFLSVFHSSYINLPILPSYQEYFNFPLF